MPNLRYELLGLEEETKIPDCCEHCAHFQGCDHRPEEPENCLDFEWQSESLVPYGDTWVGRRD